MVRICVAIFNPEEIRVPTQGIFEGDEYRIFSECPLCGTRNFADDTEEDHCDHLEEHYRGTGYYYPLPPRLFREIYYPWEKTA